MPDLPRRLVDRRTIALNCKAEAGVNRALLDLAPERFHIPAYVGAKGWLGLWLDLSEIDWSEVRELVTDAYRLAAPKKLAAQVSAARRQRSAPVSASARSRASS